MSNLSTALPLQENNLQLNDLYSNLQGNILKGHGREHTSNIFIKFTGKPEEVKRWLRGYVPKITSLKKDLKEKELFKSKKIPGGLFSTVSLSAAGYVYLGFDLNAFSDAPFVGGLKNANIQDEAFENWEDPFQKEIDALILLAYHDKEQLTEFTDALRADLSSIAIVLTTQIGDAIKNENGDGIEHFGYVDGISQPLFFEKEFSEYLEDNNGIITVATSPIDGSKKIVDGFDPIPKSGLKQVLVPDPFVANADAQGVDSYGSYFVFRKLEQNVKAFKVAEKELALKLGLKGEDVERAGAMLVGRFEDGTPVTLSDESGLINSGKLNGFNYSHDYRGDGKIDTNGSKCPFHAHIRKVNPRDEENFPADPHIMARRGIPYGERSDASFENTDLMPEKEVGLLFQSYQADIANQFEFLQETWANNPAFPQQADGIDPIIGQSSSVKPTVSTGLFPVKWGDDATKKSANFNQFVKLKGGEYFFTPSIPFFKDL